MRRCQTVSCAFKCSSLGTLSSLMCDLLCSSAAANLEIDNNYFKTITFLTIKIIIKNQQKYNYHKLTSVCKIFISRNLLPIMLVNLHALIKLTLIIAIHYYSTFLRVALLDSKKIRTRRRGFELVCRTPRCDHILRF